MTSSPTTTAPELVTLKGGVAVSVDALRLAWDLENRGFDLKPGDGRRYQVLVGPANRLTDEDKAAIQMHRNALDYDWPGNVRELQNVIERAVITSGSGPLQLDLPAANVGQPSATNLPVTSAHGIDAGVIPEATKKHQERENILAALGQTQWKVYGEHGAAALLGIKPSTLASRIKKMGLTRAK